MVARSTAASLSVPEYRALEESSQIKHEYIHGHIYAMAGGSLAHDVVAHNVRALIDAHLGDGPCRVLGPDVRLRVDDDTYYYPDALVVCDEWLDLTAVEVSLPCLIVEVLSEGTEVRDRGIKYAGYQTLSSCVEYLLVDARRRTVERYWRSENGVWRSERRAADGSLTLESIGLTCPVDALYRRTSL